MNAEPITAYRCSKCRRAFQDRDIAEKCCGLRLCYYCGKPCDRPGWTHNGACRDRSLLEKATVVDDWDGPVWVGDRMFDSVEECEDWWCSEYSSEDWPEYVFTSKAVGLRMIDSHGIIEILADDMAEEDVERLKGVTELERALYAFQKANLDVHSWAIDRKHKTPLDLVSMRRDMGLTVEQGDDA